MDITENLKHLLSQIPDNVKLIAVSKTKPNKDILELFDAGFKRFGENKVQELVKKHEELPKDIEWHYIGHLQTNKVKYIAPFVHLIHAVDSLKLLKTINKEAVKNNRAIHCLLQVHIAKESTKFGLSAQELIDLVNNRELKELTHIKIAGLMGMATYSDNDEIVLNEFKTLASLFNDLKKTTFVKDPDFKELSMGMSGDFHLAIEAGSTMVRVGSSIFGARVYK